jgi:hypothetical protein
MHLLEAADDRVLLGGLTHRGRARAPPRSPAGRRRQHHAASRSAATAPRPPLPRRHAAWCPRRPPDPRQPVAARALLGRAVTGTADNGSRSTPDPDDWEAIPRRRFAPTPETADPADAEPGPARTRPARINAARSPHRPRPARSHALPPRATAAPATPAAPRGGRSCRAGARMEQLRSRADET